MVVCGSERWSVTALSATAGKGRGSAGLAALHPSWVTRVYGGVSF